jgi:hypothetical protein
MINGITSVKRGFSERMSNGTGSRLKKPNKYREFMSRLRSTRQLRRIREVRHITS